MELDDLIMQKIASGDLGALAEIVDRYQETVWRIARRYCGDSHEAEDITQETFLRLLSVAPRYQPRGKFSSYLITIACRICLDRSAKKAPVLSNELPDLADRSPSAEELREQQEREEMVNLALASLPENQRLAIVLKYYEEMDYASIAAILQVSTKAVDGLLTRARQALACRIDQSGGGSPE